MPFPSPSGGFDYTGSVNPADFNLDHGQEQLPALIQYAQQQLAQGGGYRGRSGGMGGAVARNAFANQDAYNRAVHLLARDRAKSMNLIDESALSKLTHTAMAAGLGVAGAGALGFGPLAAGAGAASTGTGTGLGAASNSFGGAAAGSGGGAGGGLGAIAPITSAATPLTSSALLGTGGLAAAGGGAAAAGATGLGLPGWLGIGSNLLSGVLGSRAAGQASDAQTAAAQAGIDEQRRQFDQSRQDQAPWMQAGVNALGRLQDPAAFQASPGYDFRRSEGTRDLGNYFGARGGAASGNALKALADYNQNLASNEYGNWWNQQAGLAGVGQTATNQVGVLGANTAGNVGNLLSSQGNARASGILGRGLSTSNAITDALSNYLYQRNGQKPWWMQNGP